MKKHPIYVLCALFTALLTLFASCGGSDGADTSAKSTRRSGESAESAQTADASDLTGADTDLTTAPAQESQTAEYVPAVENEELLDLSADVEEVGRDGRFSVKLTALPQPEVATFDLMIWYDPAVVKIESVEEGEIPEFTFIVDHETYLARGGILIKGMTLNTIDFNNDWICTVTFSLQPDIGATETVVRVEAMHYTLGMEASYNVAKMRDVSDSVVIRIQD